MDREALEKDLRLLEEASRSARLEFPCGMSPPPPKTLEEEALILSDQPIRYNVETQRYEPCKRRLSGEDDATQNKIPKLEENSSDKDMIDITSSCKKKLAADLELPSTSRRIQSECSSPIIVIDDSVSADIENATTPMITDCDDAPEAKEGTVESTSGIKSKPLSESMAEESDLNDSQNIRLFLSPTPETSLASVEDGKKCDLSNSSPGPVLDKDGAETLQAAKVNIPQGEGFNYSENSNLSQSLKEKTTDQESTDSVSSILDSPENMPSVASKLISKLSNGNSSTPTEIAGAKNSDTGSDCTPDMIKLNGEKGDAFRGNNTTTPSTISPLQNGHSIALSTPQLPLFEVHFIKNEEGELFSLYVVRTDTELGIDMYKEYQRISRRFTLDPYLADVSVSTSPSSVTSGGLINLPIRTSSASTVSSTSSASSNRTSDGTFVVPQPPRKTLSSSGTCSIKGHSFLLKKIINIISHSAAMEEHFTSYGVEKVSVGIQVSFSPSSTKSNGNASPDEMSEYDRTTPKSSLKKTRVRGRRPLTGKTKRALLPTQFEESEPINSPEVNIDEEGKLPATPKSSKSKQKRSRPTSPRPATPVDEAFDIPGYPPGTVVLARWVDKRYYSGRVEKIIEPSKYMIKFDDGQSKTLLDDFIIFGDKSVLPLVGKSVFVLVDRKNKYEPALVLDTEQQAGGGYKYICLTDGDKNISVPARDIYLTEDQAQYIKESSLTTPPSTPLTPRRRGLREVDLDNIIQGPRIIRSRDKAGSCVKRRIASPRSPKASTSGLKPATPSSCVRKRVTSESSSVSESSTSAPQPARIEHIAGVEPEVQKTPKKIEGVKAGVFQLKGAAKQNVGKKDLKLTKLENDKAISAMFGPIPDNKKLFEGYHFILTYTDPPKKPSNTVPIFPNYSSEEDGDSSAVAGTDSEDFIFSEKPFYRDRLREQLTAGGGIVYNSVYDMPLSTNLSNCYLIAPRPCRTAKYLACTAANVRAICHSWVLTALETGKLGPIDDFVLPSGWSLLKNSWVNWEGVSGKRTTSIFKDKLILFCGDQDNFVNFWERICSHVGATTRVVNEYDMNMKGALAIVTEWDCPHEVQNKANQENIPMVSFTWIQECVIEARVIPPTSHDKFSFMYSEPE